MYIDTNWRGLTHGIMRESRVAVREVKSASDPEIRSIFPSLPAMTGPGNIVVHGLAGKRRYFLVGKKRSSSEQKVYPCGLVVVDSAIDLGIGRNRHLATAKLVFASEVELAKPKINEAALEVAVEAVAQHILRGFCNATLPRRKHGKSVIDACAEPMLSEAGDNLRAVLAFHSGLLDKHRSFGSNEVEYVYGGPLCSDEVPDFGSARVPQEAEVAWREAVASFETDLPERCVAISVRPDGWDFSVSPYTRSERHWWALDARTLMDRRISFDDAWAHGMYLTAAANGHSKGAVFLFMTPGKVPFLVPYATFKSLPASYGSPREPSMDDVRLVEAERCDDVTQREVRMLTWWTRFPTALSVALKVGGKVKMRSGRIPGAARSRPDE